MNYRLLILFFGCLGLSACSSDEVDLRATTDYRIELALAETQEAISTATTYPTSTPYATQTEYPTATFMATSTSYPTYIAYPSATIYPTFTPHPTATSTNTPTATPIVATPSPLVVPAPATIPISQDFYIIQIMNDTRRTLLNFGGAISAALENNNQIDCQQIATDFEQIRNAPVADISGLDISFQGAYNRYRGAIDTLLTLSAPLDLADQCSNHIANGSIIVSIGPAFLRQAGLQIAVAANELTIALRSVGAE